MDMQPSAAHVFAPPSPVRRLRLVATTPGKTVRNAPEDTEDIHMKIALATQDMTAVNAHFAGARTLAIYDISPQGWSLVEAVQFNRASSEDGIHDDDDRVGPRVAAIAGCALLFVKAIGGPAAAQVVNARVLPIKLKDDDPIEAVLERTRAMMAGSPPPWLRKAMSTHQDRPSFLDDDEGDASN